MGVEFGGLQPDPVWRLILGSTVVLPLVACTQVYYCPESPRWLIEHNEIEKDFKSFQTVQNTDLEVARDLYYAYVGTELERSVDFAALHEPTKCPRNSRIDNRNVPATDLWVNIIAYHSTNKFTDSGFSMSAALWP